MRRWLAALIATISAGTGGIYYGDAQVNPYEDRGSHFELPIKHDIPQGERVEIAKDRAAMTIKGWNDEYAITIEPQIPTAAGMFGATELPFTVAATRPLLSKKMEYRAGDVTAFIEPRDADNEFDIDFTLNAKPDTNVFTYKISGAEDFDFFYQPDLTFEQITEGADRPENVIGSYAVYHKTKANHRLGSTNYATGKAFHIYRPKAIDANGAEVWAELSYADGVLSVNVPQKFLDNAVYPVLVDPTFGNTTAGATSLAMSDNQVRGVIASSTVSGFVIYTSFYLTDSGATGGYKGFLTQNGIFVGNKRGSGSPTGSLSWYHSPVNSPTTTASVDYIIWGIFDEAGTGNLRYDTITYPGGRYANTNSYSNPTTLVSILANTEYYSTYATYAECDGNPGSTCTQYFGAYGSDTWTAPADVTSVTVEAWGAGGGGGNASNGAGAGGGGGGAYAKSTGVPVTPGSAYNLIIGRAGTTTSSDGHGTDGATSTFNGTTVVADGGKGGRGLAPNALGGSGGKSSLSTGDILYSGGNGGNSSDLDDSGGGGGGAAGPNGAGANGNNGGAAGGTGGTGNNTLGGAGGAGGNAGNGSPGTLSILGGGGGGGGDNGTSGANGAFVGAGAGGAELPTVNNGIGGDGMIAVTYTIPGGGSTPSVIQGDIIIFD